VIDHFDRPTLLQLGTQPGANCGKVQVQQLRVLKGTGQRTLLLSEKPKGRLGLYVEKKKIDILGSKKDTVQTKPVPNRRHCPQNESSSPGMGDAGPGATSSPQRSTATSSVGREDSIP
jgi:hypothetical protein